MVNVVIYFTLITLSACSVLAVPTTYQRREVSVAPSDILEERDYSPTMFKRDDDTASLQEREPIFPLLGILGNVGMKLGMSAIQAKIKSKRRNNRRKRELEAEDEVDLAAREDVHEFVERELDVLQREMNEDDDLLGRELEGDLYLD